MPVRLNPPRTLTSPLTTPKLTPTSANPHYLLHLATLTTSETPNTPSIPLLAHPPFIAYLSYLQYFSTAPYLKYLTYPGPTLKNLELLQNERFRRDVLSPDVVGQLAVEGVGAVAGS
jgi:mediator of RNA polymerase II transcription subunit 31